MLRLIFFSQIPKCYHVHCFQFLCTWSVPEFTTEPSATDLVHKFILLGDLILSHETGGRHFKLPADTVLNSYLNRLTHHFFDKILKLIFPPQIKEPLVHSCHTSTFPLAALCYIHWKQKQPPAFIISPALAFKAKANQNLLQKQRLCSHITPC